MRTSGSESCLPVITLTEEDLRILPDVLRWQVNRPDDCSLENLLDGLVKDPQATLLRWREWGVAGVCGGKHELFRSFAIRTLHAKYVTQAIATVGPHPAPAF